MKNISQEKLARLKSYRGILNRKFSIPLSVDGMLLINRQLTFIDRLIEKGERNYFKDIDRYFFHNKKFEDLHEWVFDWSPWKRPKKGDNVRYFCPQENCHCYHGGKCKDVSCCPLWIQSVESEQRS